MKLLSLLASRARQIVTRNEIREHLWGDQISVDFERGINFCVKEIRTALADNAWSPRYVETLARRGYRFIAPVEERAVGPETENPRSSRITLAVLPFCNLGDSAQEDYFTDGVVDMVTNELAKISGLLVTSRTSAMRYKQSNKPLREIARRLNVGTVVEGSVLRSGQRVRVTVRLIDAATEQHLWASSYDRRLHDMLDLQREVAQAIAREIRVKLTPDERKGLAGSRAVDPDTYQAYLKGLHHWNRWTAEGYSRSIGYFEQAIEKDPTYALAYAGLANAYSLLGISAVLPPGECAPKTKAAAARALALDNTLAETHTALAWVAMTFNWDWAAAESEFRRAIELNASYAIAHFWYSMFLAAMGRPEEGFREMGRAGELDPLSPNVHTGLAQHYAFMQQYDRAIEQLRLALELDGSFAVAHLWLARMSTQIGAYSEAVAASQDAIECSGQSPEMIAELGRVHAVAGNKAAARNVLEQLEQLSKSRYVSCCDVAGIYAGMGKEHEALDWLERACDTRDSWLTFSRVDPRFKSLHSREHFKLLQSKLGLRGEAAPLPAAAASLQLKFRRASGLRGSMDISTRPLFRGSAK